MTEKEKTKEKPKTPTQEESGEGKDNTYDREQKLKELLEEDEKRSPYADTFMGF